MKEREIEVFEQLSNAAQPAQGRIEMPKLILESRLVFQNTHCLCLSVPDI